jgi:shikimate kinase
VGAVLAERLGVPLRDTDRDVEAVLGLDVAEVFLTRGEAAFREVERDQALAALEDAGSGVLVLGGGAVMDPLVAEALRRRSGAGAAVVFLDVTIAHAARRLGLNAERPSGIGAPRGQWLRMMEARRPLYRDLATSTVDTDGVGPDQVADRVLAVLGPPQGREPR